jgi:hypothetical protein
VSTRTTPTPDYESLRSAAARTGYSIFTFRELIDRGELLGPVGPNLGLPLRISEARLRVLEVVLVGKLLYLYTLDILLSPS